MVLERRTGNNCLALSQMCAMCLFDFPLCPTPRLKRFRGEGGRQRDLDGRKRSGMEAGMEAEIGGCGAKRNPGARPSAPEVERFGRPFCALDGPKMSPNGPAARLGRKSILMPFCDWRNHRPRPLGGGREMAPQGLEKFESAPESGCASDALDPQYLVSRASLPPSSAPLAAPLPARSMPALWRARACGR